MEILPFIKTEVAGKKGRAAQFVQQGQNVIVAHSLAADIVANLADPNATRTQYFALTGIDVLIQKVHPLDDATASGSL